MNKSETLTSPHRHDGSSVRATMMKVCLALLPGLFCYSWFFGFGVFVQCLLAIIFALAIETILLTIRKRELAVFLYDGSTVVTALLFALMVSPLVPWWISLIGLGFGLIFAKHLYGGLGNNIFNPAVAAYVFVLLCFPILMNHWPVAGTVFSGIDSLSGATPLADMRTRITSMNMVSEIRVGPIYGYLAGVGWEWVNLAFMSGGIYLIMTGIISWRIPTAMLGSMFIISSIFSLYDPEIYASPIFHLFSGGTMLGAFFIATDPVTAATTSKGRIVYGCLIGIIAYAIRIWGAYPDGIAFAVLIANSTVPLIDQYTRPRIVGE